MKASITEIINDAVRKAFPGERDLPPVYLETPKNRAHGDYATNIAMSLASRLKKNPREIAQAVMEKIDDGGKMIKKIDVAGPGFINIILTEKYWRDLLSDIHESGDAYGHGRIGEGKRVNIEFVSANPTGPLHVGHGRGAAIGDTLARILSASGYDVTREYYINDAGSQIRNLGISINYRIREALDPDFAGTVTFPEKGYHGDYIREVADTIRRDEAASGLIDDIRTLPPEDILDPSSQTADRSGVMGAGVLIKRIASTLDRFGGISFDRWFSERALHEEGLIGEVLDILAEKGLTYTKDGALWFRSTNFGDDRDRVIRKDDGNLTYLAADIAYHREKFRRGYDRVIDVWGADHHGYIARVKGAIEALGYDPDRFRVILVQMVTLMRSGKPVTMSKRSGEFITLEEVLEEVGSDAARFFFLMRRYDSQLEFDLELAKKTTADNPVFYVQYMHARICSILRHAGESGLALPAPGEVDVDLLALPEEMEIIKFLASFPEVVEGSASSMEPHRITFFLQDLATAFHSYYNKTRVVTEDENLSRARLYMVSAAKVVVKNALTLLGVSAPESM